MNHYNMKIIHTVFKFFTKIASLIQRIRYLEFRFRYDLDKSFRFNGKGTILYGDGQIICGRGSYIGRYSSMQAVSGQKIVIGKGVSISHFVKIYTCNSLADQDFQNKATADFKYRKGDVIIGDFCWIGAGVFISEGVTIGENSVIGANSVVTKDIPPFSIAAGIPAKVLKYKFCRPINE